MKYLKFTGLQEWGQNTQLALLSYNDFLEFCQKRYDRSNEHFSQQLPQKPYKEETGQIKYNFQKKHDSSSLQRNEIHQILSCTRSAHHENSQKPQNSERYAGEAWPLKQHTIQMRVIANSVSKKE